MILVTIALTAIVTSLSTVALAGLIGGPTNASGKDVTRVKVVRNTHPDSTTSTVFETIDGAETSMVVPDDQQALILARFTAESNCFVSGDCLVRILIGNAEASPASGGSRFDSGNEFDSLDNGFETHSIEGSRVLGPGTYAIKVQFKRFSPTDHSFRVDNWHLTVMRITV